MGFIARSITASALLLAGTGFGTSAEEVFVKELTFPQEATLEQKVELASRLVPSEKQIAWQDLELTAFLHFGMNTFTNREWGDGKEDPQIFNPEGLDTDQWVKTLKDAGFRLVLLTAKHHDGFCLWPTATTAHSVASSPWLDGKGDIVAMLRESCNKYGMRMGVYLSPWDRNAECYGDSPLYNDMFVAQLTELLTNYGTIDEVWFDGACGEGPNGKKQEYDWARFKKVIETLQPGAVTAIMGDDVRWVGNERGQGRETEWSATAITPGILPGADAANDALGLTQLSRDLGSRQLLERAPKLYWWPSEVDVSIRPGWFYHANEQPKPLAELASIYLNSVGRNSVLLLNVPPDRHGRINKADVARLQEFRNWIDTNFVPVDPSGATVNCVVLSEDIRHGQRVEAFDVLAWHDGNATKVAEGTTIGKKRILTFNPVTGADSVTVSATSFRGNRHFAKVESLHHLTMPERATEPDKAYTRLDRSAWHAVTLNGSALSTPEYAIDGNAATEARSAESHIFTPLVIDMGSVQSVAGFTYLPSAISSSGMIGDYRFFTYDEAANKWIQASLPNEFSNIVNNPIEQVVLLPEPVSTRRVMLLPISEATRNGNIAIAEFCLLKAAE